MSDQELSHKDRRAARAVEVQNLIELARNKALKQLELSVGDTVPTQHGLIHLVPTQTVKADKWFQVGEWYYSECPGPFTVNSIDVQGWNANEGNKAPIIETLAQAHLTCNACGRNAIISSTRGSWDQTVDPDPQLPR